MMSGRQHVRRTWMLATLLAMTAAVFASGQPQTAHAATRLPLHVLAMGDSYTAGNGAGNYYGPAGCYRSHDNYAELLTRLLNAAPYSQPTSFNNVACSGAKTEHFAGIQGSQPPQYDAVSVNADLILLTIGGNDIGFSDIVTQCLVSLTNNGQKCETALTNAETLTNNGTLRTRITNVLKGIYGRADKNVKIVLLGYPYLIGDTDYTLSYPSGGTTRTVQVGQRVQALSDGGESIQSSLVAGLNTTYAGYRPFAFVSTKQLFSGPPWHSLYASRVNPDRWMVDPKHASDVTLSKDTYYHPNPTGWQQEAKLLRDSAAVPKSKTRPAITGGDLPGGVVGQPYSATLTATDGRTGTWTISGGGLPNGLTLNSNGTITGTPTTVGTQTVTVTFTDTLGTTVIARKKVTMQPGAPSTNGWTVRQAGGSQNGFYELDCGGNHCAAYAINGDSTSGYTFTLSEQLNGGGWSTVAAPVPAGLDSATGWVENIGCTARGDCMVLATFQQAGRPGYFSGVTWTSSGNGWTAGVIPLPSDSNGNYNADYGLSCGDDICAVQTWYHTTAGVNKPLLISWTAGGGLNVTAAPLPTGNAAPNDGTGGNVWGTGANTGSCGSGVCAMVSTYLDVNSAVRLAVWTWRAGTWSLTLPATPDGWSLEDGYNQVACGAGVCALFSYYDDGAGLVNSMIAWTWTSAGWDAGTRNPLPAVPGNFSGVKDLACATFCLATGYYGTGGGDYREVIWTWSSGKGWGGQSPTVAGMTGPTIYNTVSCGSTLCGVAGSTTGAQASAVFWISKDGVTLTPDAVPGDPYRATTVHGYGAFIACGGNRCAAWAGQPWTDLTQTKGELLFYNGSNWSANAPLPTPTNAVAGTSAVPFRLSCGTTVCTITGGYTITPSRTGEGPYEGLVWSRYDPS